MSMTPSDDIVRLTAAANPALAHLWAQTLRAAGISCKVVGEYLDAGIGDIPGVQPEIWVHKDDLPRTKEVLQQSQTVEAGIEQQDTRLPSEGSEMAPGEDTVTSKTAVRIQRPTAEAEHGVGETG